MQGSLEVTNENQLCNERSALAPTIKLGALVTPVGAPRLIEQIFTPVGGAVKALVDHVVTVVGAASKTIWKGDSSERIDVENPNPSQRPGQIHYQDNKGNK